MNTLRRATLLLVALLLAAGGAVAGPPPADLPQLLQREPIADHWAGWAPRLREWSGEHFQAAWPAWKQAFDFIKGQAKAHGTRPNLPRNLERDPVAWMVLAGAYLHDAKPAQGPIPAARAAQEAARRSIGLDRGIARAHFYLCWAYEKEQLTPREQGGPSRPNGGRLRDALRELHEARALDPNVRWMPARDIAQMAYFAEQWDDAEAFLRDAVQEKPEDGVLAAYYARALFQNNKTEEAAAQLEKARQLGTDPARLMDPGKVREIDQPRLQRAQAEAQRKQADAAWKPVRSLGWLALGFTLFYGCVMALMCLAGVLLARRTRGAAATLLLGEPAAGRARGQVVRSRHESSLERWYMVALLTALVLFYLSLPFVFVGLLIVFLATLVLGMLLRRNAEAADVHGALLRASGGGMGAVFKAMFARTGGAGFGKEKDREDCPGLFAAIDEVARRVDTEPPDEVYLSPGNAFCVHQEGRGPFGVFGSRKRVLTVGLCVMDCLTVVELKSILAHEFAHFSHADTYWNRFLFQVTLSLRTAMREMARTGGVLTYGNPFYWFFWLYSKSYSLLSAGFSRSREYLADRMACTLYGSEVFTNALRKVCTDGAHFEMTIYQNIARLLKQKKAFVNMYLAFRKHREEGLSESERRKLHKKLLADEPSMFASHPTFQEWMEAAKCLPAGDRTEDTRALALFEKPEDVEKEMTDFLTEVVDRYMGR
jgi:Zn-dependent protease with chaperone function